MRLVFALGRVWVWAVVLHVRLSVVLGVGICARFCCGGASVFWGCHDVLGGFSW